MMIRYIEILSIVKRESEACVSIASAREYLISVLLYCILTLFKAWQSHGTSIPSG